MNNAIDPLPKKVSGCITCEYLNTTSRLQVIRITNIPNWYFERITFPGQRLIFQAFPEALLEVHTYDRVTTILADHIPCASIRHAEPLDLPQSVNSPAHQMITR